MRPDMNPVRVIKETKDKNGIIRKLGRLNKKTTKSYKIKKTIEKKSQ